MKIDPNRLTAADLETTTKLDKTEKTGATDRSSGTKAASTRQQDRVEMSDDAKLMTTALEAAKNAPALRQDAIERARKLLESGELGSDSGKLADSIIDDLLKK